MLLRLRGGPENLAQPAHGQQIAAGNVERGARALGQPRIGKVHADTRQHFLDHDRLGHVVDAACLQSAHDVLGFGEPRHEDDRYVGQTRIALQPFAGLESVHARHHRVEQHDVGLRAMRQLQRGLAAGGHQHGVAGLVERVVEERDVLRQLAEHKTDREIADALYLSLRTVNWHVGSVLSKLGVATRRDAVVKARAEGLV